MNCLRTLTLIAVLSPVAFVGCGARDRAEAPNASKEAIERVAEKGPVKLVIRISPPEPKLSDLVEMDVLVTAQPGVEVKPPAFGQAVGDFLVRDYSERKGVTSATPSGQPTTHQYRYQLEPVHAGRHLVRSLAIDFVDKRPDSEAFGKTSVIESEPFEVQVNSEFGDKLPDLNDLEPMLPPKSLDQSIRWGWIMGAVICVALAVYVLWRGRRKRTLTIELPRQTPEEIAHAALNALLAEDLPSRGLIKDFYLRLTGIVRSFIEGTTGMRAPEQTTEEFLREMRSRGVYAPDRSVRLQEFLEAADMVKYAAQQPERTQIEDSITRAREFVDLSPAESATRLEPAGAQAAD